MKKVLKLTESNLINLIKNIIKELDDKQIYGQENRENYFFTFHMDIMMMKRLRYILIQPHGQNLVNQ